MKEASLDMPVHRKFARVDAYGHPLGESTILRFPHILARHKLADPSLATVIDLLAAQGLLLKAGNAVNSTLIASRSST